MYDPNTAARLGAALLDQEARRWWELRPDAVDDLTADYIAPLAVDLVDPADFIRCGFLPDPAGGEDYAENLNAAWRYQIEWRRGSPGR